MNSPFNISRWLKNQPLMPPPEDDFAAIYSQLSSSKRSRYSMKYWTVAATLAMLAISLIYLYQPKPPAENQFNQTTLAELQQHVDQLEQRLQNKQTVNVSNPGSNQLENQVMLEQWLDHLNTRLAVTDNALKQQNLLKAKLTVLQNLNPKNQTIQLI